jgi:hypothetical protein
MRLLLRVMTGGAENRLVSFGLKGHARFQPARGAIYFEAVTRVFACPLHAGYETTAGTSFRIVGQFFAGEKILLAGAKQEFQRAIAARKVSVEESRHIQPSYHRGLSPGREEGAAVIIRKDDVTRATITPAGDLIQAPIQENNGS